MDSIVYAAGVVALSIPVVIAAAIVATAVVWLLYRTAIATIDIVTQLILLKKENRKPTCSIRSDWFYSFESAKWPDINRRIRKIFTN
jgi:hypothetical protein